MKEPSEFRQRAEVFDRLAAQVRAGKAGTREVMAELLRYADPSQMNESDREMYDSVSGTPKELPPERDLEMCEQMAETLRTIADWIEHRRQIQ